MIQDYLPKDASHYLQEELLLRKARRPQYSLRAFARDLEMSPSALSEFLAGQQGMSKERARAIAEKLQFSELQQEHFWDLIESKFARSNQDRQSARVRIITRCRDDKSRLSLEKFRLVADWYHFPILELIGTEGPRLGLGDIARVLALDLTVVDAAIQRLLTLELIRENREGSEVIYEVTNNETISGDEGSNLAVQRCHEGFLTMQAQAVERKKVEERESLSFSIGINQEDWPALRKKLQKAVVSTLTQYASVEKKKDQVACCSLQVITLLPHKESQGLENVRL